MSTLSGNSLGTENPRKNLTSPRKWRYPFGNLFEHFIVFNCSSGQEFGMNRTVQGLAYDQNRF
jgi:hypothetical protein